MWWQLSLGGLGNAQGYYGPAHCLLRCVGFIEEGHVLWLTPAMLITESKRANAEESAAKWIP